jgi:hypothetical protein
MKEIRDIKIDLLMGNQNPILDMFRKITEGMGIINCDVYNKDGLEFIYYNKDGEWIFYQDVKNVEFWANYKRYWVILEREFHLEYEEIQALTKFLVEEVLKREVTTPLPAASPTDHSVEEVLKREVTTPVFRCSLSNHLVEEMLKREVTTPVPSGWVIGDPVEEALKREVATPHRGGGSGSHRVEEVLKLEVGTPRFGNNKRDNQVDEALERTLTQKKI